LWFPTLLGSVWLAVGVWKTPGFLLYLVPVLTGWMVSIPLAVWTSRPAVGDWLARHGLLPDALTAAERGELGPLLGKTARWGRPSPSGAGSGEAKLEHPPKGPSP
jgi:hypothetical protein